MRGRTVSVRIRPGRLDEAVPAAAFGREATGRPPTLRTSGLWVRIPPSELRITIRRHGTLTGNAAEFKTRCLGVRIAPVPLPSASPP